MSLPRYSKYKDSGVEWLGAIPSHWTWTQSRRMFRVRDEPACESDKHLTASQKHGMIPQAEFVELEGRRVVEVVRWKEKLLHVEPNDFVMTLRSFEGGIEWSRLRGAAGYSYVVLAPVKDVVPMFFAYLFKSAVYIQALRTTTDLVRDGQALRFSHFVQVPLPIVPEAEQTIIAAFLDRETAKIDALVAEQERLIELLKEKRQAVIAHAVTKGLNLKVPMKDSGVEWLGQIPVHWELPPVYARYNQALGKMLDQGKMTGDHPTPYLRNLDVRWDRFNVDDLPVMDIRPEEAERFMVRRGDLLMVEGRELGRSAIWAGDDHTVAFQKALHRLRPLDDTEHVRFFYYMMVFANGVGVFFADHSPDEIPHLTGEQLRRYRFPKPPLKEQVAITETLDLQTQELDSLVTEAQRAIDLLQERRAAIIAAAVTGQIDARNASGKAA